jgi:hypothetical protein
MMEQEQEQTPVLETGDHSSSIAVRDPLPSSSQKEQERVQGDNKANVFSAYSNIKKQPGASSAPSQHKSSRIAGESSKKRETQQDDDHEETAPKKLKTVDALAAPQNQKIVNPGPSDVLFGRGKPYQFHGGNQRLREVVNTYKTDYVASRRYDKLAIAEEIVKGIQGGRWGESGRFLRRADDGEDYWIKASHEEAREKVSHALRGKQKKAVVLPSSLLLAMASPATGKEGAITPEAAPQIAAKDMILQQIVAAKQQQQRDQTALLAHQLLLRRAGSGTPNGGLMGGTSASFGIEDEMKRMMKQQQNFLLFSQQQQRLHAGACSSGPLRQGRYQQPQQESPQVVAGSPLQALRGASGAFLFGGSVPTPPSNITMPPSSLSSNRSSALSSQLGFLGTNFTEISPPPLTYQQQQSTVSQQQHQNQESALMISRLLQQQEIMQQTEQFLLGRQRNFAGASLNPSFFSSLLEQQSRANTASGSSTSRSNPALANATKQEQQRGPRQDGQDGRPGVFSIEEYLRNVQNIGAPAKKDT